MPDALDGRLVRRERRTAAELESLISNAIRRLPDCRRLVVSEGVFRTDPDDPWGTTWGAYVDFSGSPQLAPCASAVAAIIADLQEKYDLI